MGLLDALSGLLKEGAGSVGSNLTGSLTERITETIQQKVSEKMGGATSSIAQKVSNHQENISFDSLPTTLSELQSLPEASLDTPFKTVALAIAALTNYERNTEVCMQMLDFLNGPEDVCQRDRQFYHDRLAGKIYKIFAFFKGATPQNGYTPTKPYTVQIIQNPYSFPEPNWCTLYVVSGGADNPMPIKLRLKPSTGQWFISELQCLGDIRIPVEQDKWA